MNKLTFANTMTVASYKAANHNNGIELIKNPKNGNLFFQCGSVIGAISLSLTEDVLKSIDSEQLRISTVEADGKKFPLLHKASEANTIRTL